MLTPAEARADLLTPNNLAEKPKRFLETSWHNQGAKMAKKKAAQQEASPHFLRRDYHHGLGGGEQRVPGDDEEDDGHNNPIENLILPRRIPDAIKRDYVRKRARGAGVGAGNGEHEQKKHNDAFGPPHLLDGGDTYYTTQHRKDMAAGGTGSGALHRTRTGNANTHAAGDGPWQVSLIFIFAIIAVLVFLLLSLLGAEPKPRIRRNNKAGPNAGLARAQRRRMSSFTTKKKKTDAWSEDEVSDHHSNASCDKNADGNDSHSSGMGMEGGNNHGNINNACSFSNYDPPPGYFPQEPQQQHRQRKPTGTAVPPSDVIMSGSSSVGIVASPSAAVAGKPKYKRSPSSRAQSQQKQHQSPVPSPPKAAVSPSVTKLTFDLKKGSSPAAPLPPAVGGGASDATYLGAGLEGFQSPQREQRVQPQQQAKSLAIPAPPLLASISDDKQVLVTPARPAAISDRQVSIDLESGHPSESEEDEVVVVPLKGDGPGMVTGPAQKLGDSSPFHSFESLPSPLLTEKNDVTEGKSSAAGAAGIGPPPRLDVSAAQQQQQPLLRRNVPQVDRTESFESPQGLRHRRITSLTSPNLAVQLGHDDMEAATPIVDNKRRIHLTRDSSHSFDSSEGHSRPSSHLGQAVPFMPNINEDTPEPSMIGPTPLLAPYGDTDDGLVLQSSSRPMAAMPFIPEFAQAPYTDSDGMGSGSESRASTHVSAPHSVPIEDLHLIRMESGHGDTYGGKWTANNSSNGSFDFARAPPNGPILPEPKVFAHSYRRQETPLHANNAHGPGRTHGQIAAKAVLQENSRQRDEGKGSEEEEEAGGNSIKHKRTDLTTWSDSAASLTSPIDFNEIKLLSVIGGGGFGQVWKANWRGTPVAVKLLSMSAQTDNVPKKVLQEFVSEINMLSGMRHPNICLYMGACLVPPNRAIVTELAAHGSVWDALRQPIDSPYIAADGFTRDAWPLSLYGIDDKSLPMTIVPGQQFYDTNAAKEAAGAHIPFAPSGTWPFALVKRVACGGCRGMIYLHSGNPPVLHRDLKSANLLLDDSYTAKIADFGLSRIKATERSMTGNCGTVQWMSPECLASSDYAEPADVYSFGIILWELLSRECPFDGQTPIQCALGVLNNDARPPIPDWCPPAFASLIRRCVTRKPSERPTFEQILDELDQMK